MLGAAALVQTLIFVASGSVALLADLIHNFGDALTAIPLGIAFVLRSARGERLAGLAVVGAIFISACVALYESIERLVHPQHLSHLWALAAAGVVGFAANEIAARVRLRAGRRLDSPALVADGNHARVDGFVSLGVVASAAAVALGVHVADPLIGLAITLVILKVTWDSWRTISAARRLDTLLHEHAEARARAVVAGERLEPEPLLAPDRQRLDALERAVPPQPHRLRLVEHGAQTRALAGRPDVPEVDVDGDVLGSRSGKRIAARASAEVRAQARDRPQVPLGAVLAVVEHEQRATRHAFGEQRLQLGLRGGDRELEAGWRSSDRALDDRRSARGAAPATTHAKCPLPSTPTPSSSGQRSTWAGHASCTSFATIAPVIGARSASGSAGPPSARRSCCRATSPSGALAEDELERQARQAPLRVAAARVPSPGPTSQTVNGAGRPSRSQSDAQLIRERLREERQHGRCRRERAAASDAWCPPVEPVVGVVQRRLHELGEGDRPRALDPRPQSIAETAHRAELRA